MSKVLDMRMIVRQARLAAVARGEIGRDGRQSAPFQAAIDFYRLDAQRREPAQADAGGPDTSPAFGAESAKRS
ncbi:MAG TPA: hypothetical protein VGF27_12445 [Pseudoduganella sp.]